MSFNIQSQLNHDFVVGVGSNNALVSQWLDYGNEAQLWNFGEHAAGVFTLQNVSTGLFLASIGSELALKSNGDLFQQAGQAIRLADKTYLNMAASGLGSGVGLSQWNGGEPNELWNLVLVNQPVTRKVMFASQLVMPAPASETMFLTFTSSGAEAQPGIPGSPTEGQVILLTEWYDRVISLASTDGSLLYFAAPDQPVALRPASQMAPDALWNFPGGGAVQVAQNTQQNLNVFGNEPKPGSVIGTWTWCGGQRNELWLVWSLGPE